MTSERHAHVKELFLRARCLHKENREEFLRQECGSDVDLLHSVTSLIEHDTTETILTPLSGPSLPAAPRVGPAPGRLLSRMERVITHMLQYVFGNPASRLVVISAVLLVLAGLASWTNRGMRRSIESIAASELQTILNADITALQLWIEEKKKDVRMWSTRPEIREAVNELVEIAAAQRDPSALRSAQALTDLRSELDEFDRIDGRPERDAVITREGLFLATGQDEVIGQRLADEAIAEIAPVFQGKTLFIKPREGTAFETDPNYDPDSPLLFFVAPIRRDGSDSSDIVAAGAFGFPADDEFTKILSVARQGTTGETYAFDRDGLLLNESRFDDQLRANGLLPNDERSRSILKIEIRDPGNQRDKWSASSVEAATRPLTVLAAQAIASGRKGSESDQQGVILDSYRNYRGAYVIGAWKWLPEYAMGVATEVEVQEQYAPMRYPIIAEWIRFGMLAGCVLLLLGAASWIVLLGRDAEAARQLGQYTLQEMIGKGGMGVVYRATHALLQRPTAIKLLRPETANEASLMRFEREAQLASGLTHPNTVEIFDFGRTPEGSFYCVMEFLDGRTLTDIVRTEGSLPVNRVVNILLQIAGSLKEAHQHGVVHRDIKPSNIMLCEQGGIPDFVKVLDFGLARPVVRSDNDVTRPGLIAGTPPYLAPERITQPALIDKRSDIYAFGAVGYYLLTGRQTYDPTNGELARQAILESPRRPSELTSHEIPEALEELIMNCLAMQADDRPNTMDEVIARIRQASE